MKVNSNKIPNIKISNNPIEQVNSFKFLGVTIDSTLSWNEHTSLVSNKVSRITALLSKLKHYLPTKTLLLIYNSLINSHLNYSIGAWGFHNCKRLLKIQKRAMRNIVRANYNAHTDTIFKTLGVPKITDIQKLACLKLYYNIKNKNAPHYFTSFINPAPENPRPNRERRLPSRFRDTTADIHTPNPLVPVVFTNNKRTRNCTRIYLPTLINGNTFNDKVLEKINTHEIKSFCKYAKKHLTDNYLEHCTGWYACRTPT